MCVAAQTYVFLPLLWSTSTRPERLLVPISVSSRELASTKRKLGTHIGHRVSTGPHASKEHATSNATGKAAIVLINPHRLIYFMIFTKHYNYNMYNISMSQSSIFALADFRLLIFLKVLAYYCIDRISSQNWGKNDLSAHATRLLMLHLPNVVPHFQSCGSPPFFFFCGSPPWKNRISLSQPSSILVSSIWTVLYLFRRSIHIRL